MLHAHVRITRRRLRTAARATAVLCAAGVLWLPGAPAHAGGRSPASPAFPPTVIRSTPVPLATMVDASGVSMLSMLP